MYKEVLETVTFISYYKDFNDSLNSWQEAYFMLLSWKNTFNTPIKMDIESTGTHEAYLHLVVKKEDSADTKTLLEELGYKEIRAIETKTIEITVDDVEDIDYIQAYLGW